MRSGCNRIGAIGEALETDVRGGRPSRGRVRGSCLLCFALAKTVATVDSGCPLTFALQHNVPPIRLCGCNWQLAVVKSAQRMDVAGS